MVLRVADIKRPRRRRYSRYGIAGLGADYDCSDSVARALFLEGDAAIGTELDTHVFETLPL